MTFGKLRNWFWWIVAFCGCAVLPVCWEHLLPDELYVFPFALGLISWIVISVIIHECAHMIVGRILGFKPWSVCIGKGSVLKTRNIAGLIVSIREFPFSGVVHATFAGSNTGTVRVRRFLFIAAGPASNAVLAYCSFVFLPGSVSAESFTNGGILMQILLANIWAMLASLPPSVSRNGSRSDGLQMMEILFGKNVSEFYGYRGKPWESNWLGIIEHIPIEPLLAKYREALNNPAVSSKMRAISLDGFATAVLMYGANEYLPEADRYSLELTELQPNEWTVKGTRGSVLIEMNEINSGTALLREVIEKDPNNFDRAICAAYLGLAEIKCDNEEKAREWLAKSRELDPMCGVLPRIEAIANAHALGLSQAIKAAS